MEEADLFIDDIDGIFDDDDDGPPTDDEQDHASFGDEDDDDMIHDSSSLAVDACSSFPLMMDDGDEDEVGQHLPMKPPSTSASSDNLPLLEGKGGASRASSAAIGGLPLGQQHDHESMPASNARGDLSSFHATLAPQPDSSSSSAAVSGVSSVAAAGLSAPSRRRSVSEPGAAGASNVKHKTMRRSGKHLEAKVCPQPPPTWHSEAADRHHRQAMILEIARLLQARKKSVPSSEWLRQLPHKARKLEERLYRSSTSLEAYLDKTTLKTRLKKLARAITRQFEQAKKQRMAAGGGNAVTTSALGWNQPGLGLLPRHRNSDASIAASVSSMASFAASSTNSASSSFRDSFSTVNSIDSLRSFRESFLRRATTTGGSTGIDTAQGSTMNGSNALPAHEATGGDKGTPSTTAVQRGDSDSTGDTTKGGAADATCITAPTSSSTTPQSSENHSAGRPSPKMSSTDLAAGGEGNSASEPASNPVESAVAGRSVQSSFVHASGQAQQLLLESMRNQPTDGARRIQGQQGGGIAPATSFPALTRSSSNGYNRAGAAAAAATSVPVQVPSALQNRPLSMFSAMGASAAANGTDSNSTSLQSMSHFQMNSNMLAAAILNQHVNGGGAGGAATGAGPAVFPSMGGTGSLLNPQQHLAAKAALHPSMLASMNNRSMLQQAFLEATAQSLGPGFFGGAAANQSQLLQPEQQRQLPFPPIYPGASMAAGNSHLIGPGGGGVPVSNFEQLFPGGPRPATLPPMPIHALSRASSAGHPAQPPPPMPAGLAHSQSMQGVPAPRPLAQPPATTHSAKAGSTEDSEPLSPSSFNWY